MTATAAWSASWARLRAECPDINERWPAVECLPAVARAMAACGREAGRLARGIGDLAELENRLRVWELAVLKALAEADHAKSERLCLDCGDADVPTVAPGLTSGRICARCSREATP